MFRIMLNLTFLVSLIVFPSYVTNSSSRNTYDGPVTIEVGSLAAHAESRGWLNREIQAFQMAYPNITVKTKGFLPYWIESVTPFIRLMLWPQM